MTSSRETGTSKNASPLATKERRSDWANVHASLASVSAASRTSNSLVVTFCGSNRYLAPASNLQTLGKRTASITEGHRTHTANASNVRKARARLRQSFHKKPVSRAKCLPTERALFVWSGAIITMLIIHTRVPMVNSVRVECVVRTIQSAITGKSTGAVGSSASTSASLLFPRWKIDRACG